MAIYISVTLLFLLLATGFIFGGSKLRLLHKSPVFLPFIIFISFMALGLVGNYHWRDLASVAELEARNTAYQALVKQYLRGEPLENPEAIEPGDFIRAIQVYIQGDSRNTDAWLTLGNALRASGSDKLALRAYERAYRVDPDKLEIAFTYVNARLSFAESQGRMLVDKQAVEVLETILRDFPENANALMLLGAAGFQGQDFEMAITAWTRLLEQFEAKTGPEKVPEDVIKALQNSISEARERMRNQKHAAGQAFQLRVRVELPEQLTVRLDNSSVLFVFLRPREQKGGMPLAAIRKPLTEASFPLEVLIDQESSLMGLDLSTQGELEVAAHISLSGNAKKETGDLYAEPQFLKAGELPSEAMELVLENIVGQ